MLKWLSCSACRLKDQQLEEGRERERRLWGELQKLNSAIIERSAPPAPAPLRPRGPVRDQSEVLQDFRRPKKPPWAHSLAADGHVLRKPNNGS